MSGVPLAIARASAAPVEDTGPRLWLKADAITAADGDPVGTWADSSGNGHDATSSGTARPTYKTSIINGLPVVRFDGSDDYLDLGDLSASFSTAASLFIVSTFGAMAFLYNAGAADTFWLYSGNGDGYFGTFQSVRHENYPASLPTGTHLWSLLADNASRYEAFLDGVSKGNVYSGAYTPGTSHKLGRNDIPLYGVCDIAEVIIYGSVLSPEDQATVETDLMTKYGL